MPFRQKRFDNHIVNRLISNDDVVLSSPGFIFSHFYQYDARQEYLCEICNRHSTFSGNYVSISSQQIYVQHA